MKDMLVASEVLTTGWCPLNCEYCVTVDTKILMADYTWKEIKDVREGDEILTITENPVNGRRRIVKAKVLAKHVRTDDVYEIVTEEGYSIKVSDNHPLLGYSDRWYQLNIEKPSDAPNKNKLKEGIELRFVAEPVVIDYESDEYKIGYLRGIIDGDGVYVDRVYEKTPEEWQYLKKIGRKNLEHKYRITMRYISVRRAKQNRDIVERVIEYLNDLGIDYTFKENSGMYRICICKKEDIDKIFREYDSREYKAGYLAGIFDAEGSVYETTITIWQYKEVNPDIFEKIKKYLDEFGFNVREVRNRGKVIGLRITGIGSYVKFRSIARSVKISRSDSILDMSAYFKRVRVKEIRYVGKETVYNLMTSERTYISDGFISHNCYIPKTDKMKEVHLDIVKDLKSKIYLKRMKEMKEKYGIRLEHLGAWGTEPILTMRFIDLKEWKEEFPELETFAYSTSMMVKPTPVLEKVKEADELGIRIKHQISLDGPSWITDKNRKGGSTETIIENTKWLVEELNKIDFKTYFEISFKATWSIDNIRQMVENPELINEVFEFFDNLVNELRQINKKRNIAILNFAGGTLVVPGKYTSEDGKVLAKFFEYLYKFEYPNNYTYRLMRVIDWGHELYKAKMFSCSAMDSQFGFDDEGAIHLCHRTYYFNKKEYIENVMQMDEYKNWDVSVMEQGRMREINKYYIISYDNDFEMWRLYYVMRGYHDFWKHKVGYVVNMMKMLASVGQAEERFLYDEDYTKLFAFFINSAFSCPMENLLNTGSVHLTPVSILRYLGNGAFAWLVRDAYRIYKRQGVL